MNEPAVFDGPGKTMPLDNIHRIEEPGFATRTATHSEIHNIVGLENARATYEGLLKLRPNERPFVLTRATFAGGQRYGFTWTGDNSSTWNHLRLATQQLLNLGLSGISFVGDDIGGFNGSPPPDLLTRWIEIGAFNPMYRDHSTKGSLMQEVWVHGPEQEAIRRRYIETRYRLLPYIYTLADESSRTGIADDASHFSRVPGSIHAAIQRIRQSRHGVPAGSQPAGRSATVRRDARRLRRLVPHWPVVRLLDRPQSARILPEPNIVEIATCRPGSGPPRAFENSSCARHPAGLCPGRKHSAAAAAHSKHR